jgi:hypothetical protein
MRNSFTFRTLHAAHAAVRGTPTHPVVIVKTNCMGITLYSIRLARQAATYDERQDWVRTVCQNTLVLSPRASSAMSNCTHGVENSKDCRECRADGVA